MPLGTLGKEGELTMGRPKLLFKNDADKATAVYDYIRQHVAEIDFKGTTEEVATITGRNPWTIQSYSDDENRFKVVGDAELLLKREDGTLSKWFKFSMDCTIIEAEDNTPQVSNLSYILVTP